MSLREDILVSVCLGEMDRTPSDFALLADFATTMNARFRFWEIIVVASADEVDPLLHLVQDVANIRLIKVRHGTEFYRRRVIAAAEAIGDVVLLTTLAELPRIDVLAMIETAHADEGAVIAKTPSVPLMDRLIATPLVGLGRWAGFNVGIRDMQSIAVARTLLNQLLAHPAKELALRFLPRDVGVTYSYQTAQPAPQPTRSLRDFGRRLGLAQTLMINLAPRLLKLVTLISALTALMSFLFIFYIVVVWLVLPGIAPGWTSLSMMLAVTGFMLGCTSSALCLGVLFMLSRMSQDEFDDVAGEVNRVDLFGKVAADLNVEVVTETQSS